MFGIKPFSAGPYTPWPNRAEAAVRVVKATRSDLCAQLGSSPELKKITPRELLRKLLLSRSPLLITEEKRLLSWLLEDIPEMW